MARRVAERADDSGLYLYAGTKFGAGDPPQLRGVDGQARIEAIACAGLTCWISRVSSSEFGESFSKRLEDLDWLAVVSVRHQRAVAAIAESRDTLPARLGTVFLSEASLEADIRKRKAALDADLRRIAGTQEWGIRSSYRLNLQSCRQESGRERNTFRPNRACCAHANRRA